MIGGFNLKYTWLALFLFVFPFVWGLPWVRILPEKGNSRIAACIPIGFFVEMGVFQLVGFPFAVLQWRFSSLCQVFLILLCLGSCISLAVFVRHPIKLISFVSVSVFERIYLIVFLVLLGIQLFCAYFYDTTYMSYDDAAYVAYSADAVKYNSILLINPYTGLSSVLNIQRAMQSFNYYPAVLSYFSGVSVTIICRTILEMFDVLLAFSVYAYMSTALFTRMDNRLIFLILVSVLYIFGYYSHYSITFRLLGPNYQGKAIVATCMFPLMLTIFVQMLRKKFNALLGALLFFFSGAATGFSLFGSVTMIPNCVIPIALSMLVNRRDASIAKYIICGCALPVVHCMIYFYFKYFLW